MIDRNSRYANAPRQTLMRPDGTEIQHVVPPMLSHPEDHTQAQLHRVTDSDRPDTLAARIFGQATAWWMLCNANTAAHPDQLTETTGAERSIPSIETAR